MTLRASTDYLVENADHYVVVKILIDVMDANVNEFE